MSNFFDEHDADQAVIDSLLRHISASESRTMEKIIIYRDKYGNIQRATDTAPISREEIAERVDELSGELQQWQDALAEYDRLTAVDGQADIQAPDENSGHVDFRNHPKFKRKTVDPPKGKPILNLKVNGL
jgi:hypothetical protein